MLEVLSLILEALKYILPAILVLVAMKFMNDHNLKKEQLNQGMWVRSKLLKQQLPLRLAAYERAVLYLERISPQNLLLRVSGAGKPAREFSQELVQEIRTEYEHNLVQQVYISNAGWKALSQAKEEMLGIIHQATHEVGEKADGLALSRKILEKCSELKELSAQNAIIVLKSDLRGMFKI